MVINQMMINNHKKRIMTELSKIRLGASRWTRTTDLLINSQKL